MITHTNLLENSRSLPIVGGNYSFTRTRNDFASLIMSIESVYPHSYWYTLSDNGIGSLCELLRVEECIFTSILKTFGHIHWNMVNNNLGKDK